MIKVGLTGGIGAGKSTVAETLVARGAYHVDADRIAREVVEPGTPGLAALVSEFGDQILADDGSLNRPGLAAVAFADEESRQRLNGVTHPLIGARTQELFAQAPADAIILHDVPLLVEGAMAPFYHVVLMVHADVDVRVHRLTELRGMPEADARARIAAQASEEKRREVADVWLDNSGAPGELAADAARVWDEVLVPLEKRVRTRTVPPVHREATLDVEAFRSRVVNRLWALAGDKATSVDTEGVDDSGDAPALVVTLTARDASAAAELEDVLADGGFPPIGDGRYGSADVFRPVTLTVRTAS
ncbi:MAG: dephospho-CoA kinase [Gordonia sp. (in: high G+C Gram-positive bacteria)]